MWYRQCNITLYNIARYNIQQDILQALLQQRQAPESLDADVVEKIEYALDIGRVEDWRQELSCSFLRAGVLEGLRLLGFRI